MKEPQAPNTRDVYHFADYILDVAARVLTREGQAVPLTPKAFEILRVLVVGRGRAVPRAELLETVWPDTIVEPGNLDWNVSALRKALGETGLAIETVRGFGYRFAIPVFRQAPVPTPIMPPPRPAVPPASPAPEVSPGIPTPVSGEVRAAGGSGEVRAAGGSGAHEPPSLTGPGFPAVTGELRASRLRPWIPVFVLGLAVIGFVTFTLLRPAREQAGVVTTPVTVAVLAFENLSPDASSAWLSTALRELVSADLAGSEGLTMIPGETVARTSADLKLVPTRSLSPESLARLRGSLGTDLVVTGSFLATGGSLRVDVTLQDCATGSSMANVQESGSAQELLKLASAVGTRLRKEMGRGSVPLSAAASPFSGHPDALRPYTEGLAKLRGFEAIEARDLLLRAVTADPKNPLAHSALAEAWSTLGFEGRAAEEARKALELSAVLSRGDRLVVEAKDAGFSQKWEKAAEIYKALSTFYPENLDHGLSLVDAQSRAGQHLDALESLHRLEAMPEPKRSDPRIDIVRGWAARFRGDFEGMKAAGLEAERKGKERGAPHLVAQALVLQAWSDVTLSRPDDTLARCEEGAELATSLGDLALASRHLALCGWAYMDQCRLDQSREVFTRALELGRRVGFQNEVRSILAGLARIALRRGEVEESDRLLVDALDLCRTTRDLEGEVNALASLSWQRLLEGKVKDGRRLADESLVKARQLRISSRIASGLCMVGEAKRLDGDFKGAIADLEQCAALREGSGPFAKARAEIRLARVHLQAGNGARALEVARGTAARLEPLAFKDLEDMAGLDSVLAEALAANGATAEAARVAKSAEEMARRADSLPVLLEASLARGRVAGRAGDAATERRIVAEVERVAKEKGLAVPR